MSCDGWLLLMGPIFTLLGAFTLGLGIAAWKYPNSEFVQNMLVRGYAPEQTADPISRFLGFTREKSGPGSLQIFRILGPFNGSVFFIVGIWATIAQLQCRAKLPNLSPLIGPLEWRFWPPMIVFIALTLILGISGSWRVRPLPRLIFLLLLLCWSSSGGEAAAFHTGIQANRWSALAFAITPLLYVTGLILKKYFTVVPPEAQRN